MRMNPDTTVMRYRLEPHQLTGAITPTENLWTLAHMGLPEAPQDDWTLTIDGLVDRPVTLSLGALRARPRVEVEAVQNCAGSPFAPTVPTRQVANLRWAGTSLSALLAEAGPAPAATHLWAYGADHGTFAKRPADAYLKDSPLSRYAVRDALIAWELNGQPLALEHGGPARLVIPGFYATNSVKWLRRLEMADRRATGLFCSELYNDPALPHAPARPVWAIEPDSVIVAPEGEIRAGEAVEIWGWAWADDPIASVGVSLDGGGTWTEARLAPRREQEWQRFSLHWTPDAPGEMQILSRATDIAGRTQPMEGARNEAFRRSVVVAP